MGTARPRYPAFSATGGGEPTRIIVEHKIKEFDMPLLNESEAAPEFSLPNQDDTATTLSQHRGKHVILWWYPKADTPG